VPHDTGCLAEGKGRASPVGAISRV